MDPKLKEQLRELGLLPVYFDEQAQEAYRNTGIDSSQIEQHVSPGTPPDIHSRLLSLEDNLQKLYDMEDSDRTGTLEYLQIEGQIRVDVSYIQTRLSHAVEGAFTGIYGQNRDQLSQISRQIPIYFILSGTANHQ